MPLLPKHCFTRGNLLIAAIIVQIGSCHSRMRWRGEPDGTFDAWKPPIDVLPEPLSRIVTMLGVVAMFVGWILAEPNNQASGREVATRPWPRIVERSGFKFLTCHR